jgi:hypothetical protein
MDARVLWLAGYSTEKGICPMLLRILIVHPMGSVSMVRDAG